MTAMLNMAVTKETVSAARAAIIEILKSDSDEETKKCALATLSTICEVKNAQISNNVFNAK